MRKLNGLSGAVSANYTLVNANITAGTSGIPDRLGVFLQWLAVPVRAALKSPAKSRTRVVRWATTRRACPWRLGVDACLAGGNTTGLNSDRGLPSQRSTTRAPASDLMRGGLDQDLGRLCTRKPLICRAPILGRWAWGGMAMGNNSVTRSFVPSHVGYPGER